MIEAIQNVRELPWLHLIPWVGGSLTLGWLAAYAIWTAFRESWPPPARIAAGSLAALLVVGGFTLLSSRGRPVRAWWLEREDEVRLAVVHQARVGGKVKSSMLRLRTWSLPEGRLVGGAPVGNSGVEPVTGGLAWLDAAVVDLGSGSIVGTLEDVHVGRIRPLGVSGSRLRVQQHDGTELELGIEEVGGPSPGWTVRAVGRFEPERAEDWFEGLSLPLDPASGLRRLVVHDDAAFAPIVRELSGVASGGGIAWTVPLEEVTGGVEPMGALTVGDDLVLIAGSARWLGLRWLDPATGTVLRAIDL